MLEADLKARLHDLAHRAVGEIEADVAEHERAQHVEYLHEHDLVAGRVGADEARVRDRVGYLLHTIDGGVGTRADQAVRDELVDGGERQAGHVAARVLGLDHLEERRHERARIDLAQVRVVVERQLELVEVARERIGRMLLFSFLFFRKKK